MYFLKSLSKIKVVDSDVALELDKVIIIEWVHRLKEISLMYLVT